MACPLLWAAIIIYNSFRDLQINTDIWILCEIGLSAIKLQILCNQIIDRPIFNYNSDICNCLQIFAINQIFAVVLQIFVTELQISGKEFKIYATNCRHLHMCIKC